MSCGQRFDVARHGPRSSKITSRVVLSRPSEITLWRDTISRSSELPVTRFHTATRSSSEGISFNGHSRGRFLAASVTLASCCGAHGCPRASRAARRSASVGPYWSWAQTVRARRGPLYGRRHDGSTKRRGWVWPHWHGYQRRRPRLPLLRAHLSLVPPARVGLARLAPPLLQRRRLEREHGPERHGCTPGMHAASPSALQYGGGAVGARRLSRLG